VFAKYCVVLLTVEIIERGEHTLEVGVTYTSNSSPHPRTFRKMYNFTTFDTIAIRSQSRTLPSRTVLFQMHIENIGDTTLHLKQVKFHTEPVWDAQSCNELPPGAQNGRNNSEQGEGQEEGELSVFMGRGLDPKGVYQVMFILNPKSGVEGEMPFHLGRLEIEWVGSMGEKGSIITGMMKRRPL
jgi:hypothetical protein